MESAKPNKEDIVISLNDSSNTRSYADHNRVHEVQFEKAIKWIKQAIIQADKKTPQRLQETISILGSRGSGKTSFLLSLIEEFKNNPEVVVIQLIDPTLIEQKGHIFLTIISQIKDLVDEKFRGCDCRPDSPEFASRQTWEKKLERLAHGLPTVNGVGKINEESWQDPEYIMHKGLQAVHSAKNLEENFKEFVECSLKILGNKKIFLLPLDDIDVDFQRGWPVLETLRKYLTTPRIVTLISGDIDLFAKAIRKQQWKNFGKALLMNEGDQLDKMKEYNDLVTEMESQYLQKVLKPEKRIRLNTLWEKWQMGIHEICIEEGGKDNIVSYYKEVLKAYGIINPTQAKAYYSFLMSLPLRTQIQFLACNQSKINTDEVSKLTQMDIIEPFLSNLIEKQVNIELANNVPELLNVVILQLLLREKILSEAYQLQPTATDINNNVSLLALSLLFSEKVKGEPFLIFDYMIKIGYIRNLVDVLGYKEDNEKGGVTIAPSIEGLCSHAEMFQDNVLRNVVGNITAYLTACLDTIDTPSRKGGNGSNKDRQNFWSGILRLYGFAFKAKESNEAVQNRIDYVFKGEDYFSRALAFFPLSVARPSYSNVSSSSYSVFMLLGTIGEFLKFEDETEINNHIQKLSQIRSYPMPNFKTAIGAYEETEVVEGDATKTDNKLAELIFKWKEAYPKNEIALAPYVLGKIITRFYYALRAIEEKDKSKNLGEAVHYRIVAFLNAVLLEDARENLNDISDLNHSNTNFSEEFFLSNLKKLQGIKEGKSEEQIPNEDSKKVIDEKLKKLCFSRWILACPLLLSYLDIDKVNENSVLSSYALFGSINFEDDIKNKSIYQKLCIVGTKDQKPVFSGAKGKVIDTVRKLMDCDPNSYTILESKNIDKIKAKYEGTVFSKIDPSSLKSFWENIKFENSEVKEWIAASQENQNNSDEVVDQTPDVSNPSDEENKQANPKQVSVNSELSDSPATETEPEDTNKEQTESTDKK